MSIHEARKDKNDEIPEDSYGLPGSSSPDDVGLHGVPSSTDFIYIICKKCSTINKLVSFDEGKTKCNGGDHILQNE
jgi:hypothetical protein